MKRFWIVVILGFLGTSLVSSDTSDDEPLRAIMRKFNRKLYRTVSRAERGNFVFSPFSLHMVLTLIYLGAPEESETRKELEELLNFEPNDEEIYLKSYHSVFSSLLNNTLQNTLQMELANRIYAAADLDIKKEFVQKIDNIYNSKIEKVDFNDTKLSTELINNFVKNSTKGIIPKLFDDGDLDVLTRLVMVNAVYFKGDWENPFDPKDTKPMEFQVDSNQSFLYPHGMNLFGNLRFAKIDELYDANVLELPYSGSTYFMNIVMPHDSHNINDLDHFMGRFDTDKFEDRLFDQSVYSDVKVTLPKFDITFEWNELDQTLEKLGVKTLFDAKKSNLTNISDDPLHVSKVVHKASISVNEEGSEAAASSGLALDTRSGIPNDLKEFVVNRPFIFYIYDKENNLPLFFGRVVDPSGKRKLDDNMDDEDKNDIESLSDANIINFSGSKNSHLNNFKQNKEFEDQRWKEAFDQNNKTQT